MPSWVATVLLLGNDNDIASLQASVSVNKRQGEGTISRPLGL